MARVNEIVGAVLSFALAAGCVIAIGILALNALVVLGRISEAVLRFVGVY